MGIDEYFYSGNWCFVEWPKKLPNLIPLTMLQFILQLLENGKSELKLINS